MLFVLRRLVGNKSFSLLDRTRTDARPKKPRRLRSRPCLGGPRTMQQRVRREGGSSASEMRGLCGAVWYTVPRRGCPSSLCAFLYSAHPRVLSFLPRSFLVPPARRCRQDPKPLPACVLARSLRRETQASVVLGPSRAFGRPARLSWNPGRIRGFLFVHLPPPLLSLFSYAVFRERKMLLDSLMENSGV